jgi:lysophospholipase L1-like esterase
MQKIKFHNIVIGLHWVFLAFVFQTTGLAQDFGRSSSSVFLNARNEQWISFVKKLKGIDTITSHKINILQIGDSHIQGGYFTNQVRNLLSTHGYKMSTGLTFPYALAKTNGTEEIRYYSPNQWTVGKVAGPSPGKLSIAGYVISSSDTVINISLKFNALDSDNWTERVRFYHNSPSSLAASVQAQHIETHKIMDSIFVTEFHFSKPVDSVQISFFPRNGLNSAFQILSVEMDNHASKAFYHSLGINGITFDGYVGKVNYVPWMKQIAPDCLVISFGTNDIYSGKINTTIFAHTVGSFIDSLQRLFPGMVIIITSPGDHLRLKKYNNQAIPIAVKVLHDLAYQKNCLFWDFFTEMGGEGSCREWYKRGWMFRDYVHLSKEGYKQQGNMFFNAFMNTVEQTWQNGSLKAGIN